MQMPPFQACSAPERSPLVPAETYYARTATADVKKPALAAPRPAIVLSKWAHGSYIGAALY